MADFRPDIDPINVRPTMGTYNNPQTFRFWCQKVLPLVYDNSLSYYELLCKVVDYLNKTMEDVNTAVEDVTNLNGAFGQLENHVNASEAALLQAYTDLQNYVNNYFDSLDFQEAINNKLDEMAEDGTLDALLLPHFNEYVESANAQIQESTQNMEEFVLNYVAEARGQIRDATEDMQDTLNTSIISQNNRISTVESEFDQLIALQTAGTMQGAKITTFVANNAVEFTLTTGSQSFSFVDYAGHITTTPAMSTLDGLSDPILVTFGAYVLDANTDSPSGKPLYVDLTNEVRYYPTGGYLGSAPDKRALRIDVPVHLNDTVGNLTGKYLLFTFSTLSTVPTDLSEVTDIRVGADGTTYATAGDAVRSQIGDLKSAYVQKTIAEYGTVNIGTLNSGRYILATTGLSSTSANWSYSNFLPVNDAKAFLLTSPTNSNSITQQYVASVAFYSSDATDDFISAETIRAGADGESKWVVVNVPPSAEYMRLSVWTASASVYQIIPILDVNALSNEIFENEGYKHIDLSFTATSQIKVTELDVKAGCTYRIKINTHYSESYADRLNVFSNGTGGSSNYIVYCPYNDFADFVCGVDGKLTFYNIGGYIGNASFDVYWNLNRVVDNDPIVYRVDQNGDHASLTALLLQLKNDTRPKIIEIAGGDYNIFAEYKALQNANKIPTVPTSNYSPATEYVPYNVFVPDNTHIIGKGLVRLLYEPDAEDTYTNEAETLSPLNVGGSCTIENIEVYCKNGRYAIHDDPMRNPVYNGAVKKYINVKAVKEIGTLGYRHCFGCGISREMTYIFENCTFSNLNGSTARTFYFHDRQQVGGVNLQEKMSSRIVANNCKFLSAGAYSVFFGNIGVTPAIRIRVDLNNCYVNQAIVSADESEPSAGTQPNSFDITATFCKYGNLVVRDTNNPYPPTVYSY